MWSSKIFFSGIDIGKVFVSNYNKIYCVIKNDGIKIRDGLVGKRKMIGRMKEK